MSAAIRKVVLAYSGGLDTSVIIKWLIERYGCEVIAFSADLGQGEELAPVRKKALATGASKVYIEDLKETFVRDYVFPMLRAGAVYEGSYLLGTSIARPLIAKAQIEIARREKADAVAHGATGKGNDQVRFELTYMALAPGSRLSRRGGNGNSSPAGRSSTTRGNTASPSRSRRRSRTPRTAISSISPTRAASWRTRGPSLRRRCTRWPFPSRKPRSAGVRHVRLREGKPHGGQRKAALPASLLAEANRLGGKHGIGRVDLVENRYVGMKSRGVYETPGGTLLHAAHRAVESVTLDREVMRLRDQVVPKYAELVYYGYWFAPEREALQALVDSIQEPVTGTARLKLYKGNVMVVGRKAPRSLYNLDLATFEEEAVYNQKDAEGFIRLNALRLRVERMARKAKTPPRRPRGPEPGGHPG